MKPVLLLFVFVILFGSVDAYSAGSNPRLKELQKGLIELGYDPGSADGLMGPKTQEAIISFQKDHDFTVDGKFSGIVLFHVNVQLRIAKEEATPEASAEAETPEAPAEAEAPKEDAAE